ncbi:361_t:CDS:1 [Funneliformis geosporum]|uniref:12657_t:CDS:1 n=1 Tax=Funneliformis geosporum TaxID=1117311 RepID=A0A9W4X224_9GLOM|nr:361_t:CDS:1 [Funneliformis geosporum]CAI2180731.1 12657_t:CDS:1 [Funneliformis geosporum]
MSKRKQSSSNISNASISIDKVELIFSKKNTFQMTKSQILKNDGKLIKCIEDALRYINVFNYPYEMVYYVVKDDNDICYSIRSDKNATKNIEDLLKELIISDKGKKIDKIYFLADKKVF